MKGYAERISGKNITFRVGRIVSLVTLPVKKGHEGIIDFVCEHMNQYLEVFVDKGEIVDVKAVLSA